MPASRSPTPDHYLRRAHRRARSGLLLWALIFATLATAVSLAPRLAWLPDSFALEVGRLALILASACVLVLWLRRLRHLNPSSLARRLDAELSLSARLETSAELAHDSSVLADAQRADAAQHLSNRTAPPAIAWFAALTILALTLLLLLSQLTFLGFRYVHPTEELSTLAALSPDISATLTWQNPESEIKATAIEEIPLTALIVTRTGLRSLSLEISVNGEPRLSRPLPADALAPLHSPGEHPLELELYLDEVGAEEFDLVSYHLRAERDTPAPTPVVASPLQFIQIRPARDDVTILRPPPGSGATSLNVLANLLGNLKAAQLQLLKQNFILTHAALAHDSPIWLEENARISADQETLTVKTTEAREFAIAESLPTLVVDNLGLCIPLMDTASALIASAENEPATRPQGRALGHLVDSEKLIRKVIIQSSSKAAASPPSSKNHDPFKDKQEFKLPPREQTPAGQLESLAQAQAQAAAKPAKDPLAEQAELAERLAKLDAAKSLDPAAQVKTTQAARDAAAAAQQLTAGDTEAARSPAASAAAALREAAAAQEAAGLAAAQAELEKIRLDIHAAERLTDPAARTAALSAAAENLRTEAAQQQQTGSTAAAKELANAALKTAAAAKTSPDNGPPTGKPGTNPKPSDATPGSTPSSGSGATPGSGKAAQPSASHAAAKAQAALTPRDQALARAARQLNRAASPNTPAPIARAELELGTEFASVLLADPAAEEVVRILRDNIRRDDLPVGNAGIIPENLREPVARLIALLEAARLGGERDEQVRRFNPDDFDPAYRSAIEAYFEKLSRDAAKR